MSTRRRPVKPLNTVGGVGVLTKIRLNDRDKDDTNSLLWQKEPSKSLREVLQTQESLWTRNQTRGIETVRWIGSHQSVTCVCMS